MKRLLPTRFHVVRQAEQSECGLACVAMILRNYGRKEPLHSLRTHSSFSSKGTNLKRISDLLLDYGVIGRAVSLEMEGLQYLRLPAILHWDFDHFVVLTKVNRKSATVADPAKGLRTLSFSQLSKSFTGVALETWPDTSFTKSASNSGLRWHQLLSDKPRFFREFIHIVGLALLFQVSVLTIPFYSRFVVDDVITSGSYALLPPLASAFLAVVCYGLVVEVARGRLIANLSARLNLEMAGTVGLHLFRLPLSFFERRHIGDVVSRFRSLESIRDVLSQRLVSALVDGALVAGSFIFMAILAPSLIIVVLAFSTCMVSLRWYLTTRVRDATEQELDEAAREQTLFLEGVRAISVLKGHGIERTRVDVWQTQLIRSLNARLKKEQLSVLDASFIRWFGSSQLIAALFFGAYLYAQGALTIGSIFAFVAYMALFSEHLKRTVDVVVQLRLMRLHLARVADIVLTEEERQGQVPFERRWRDGHSFSVRSLGFQYSDGDPAIFSDLDLEIEPGEFVAITGESGCGKTTLLKILAGLLVPTKGHVFVNSMDLSNIRLSDYRASIAIVQQDDQLIGGSLAENIALLGDGLNFERVKWAAAMAEIHQDILCMPMQYYSLVGDMGSSLSGGQKQRIVLARALYRQPACLFLDEATSHLDNEVESRINENLKRERVTRIAVAHRENSIASADRIIKLSSLERSTAERKANGKARSA